MNIAADRPEKITEPGLRMDPISAERYTSTDWFHREWKQMWMRTWQIGGLSGHAPEPDPAKCYFDHWWMVHEIEGRKFTPSPAGGPDLPVEDAPLDFVKYGEKSLGRTADQDLSIGAIQQLGLRSAGFGSFYLCHQERRVQHFHEVLNDYMSMSR
jgi:hypothetical protein